MNDSRRSLAVARILDLRTPLSRIALAASHLGRGAGFPAPSVLSASIAEAIGDLDARIDAILPLLAEVPPAAAVAADAGTTLAELHQRVAPGLEGRGIAFLLRGGGSPEPGMETHLMRRASVALLRAGARWAGPGGQVALGIADDGGRPGLELECRRPISNPIAADPEEALVALQEFSEIHQLRVEQRLPDPATMVLRLQEGEP